MIVACALVLALIAPARADFDLLEQTQPAPYRGYLITPEREKKLRLMSEELDLYKGLAENNKKILENYKESVSLYQERLNVAQKDNSELNDKLRKHEEYTFWKYAGMFTLGILTSVATAFAVSQAVK